MQMKKTMIIALMLTLFITGSCFAEKKEYVTGKRNLASISMVDLADAIYLLSVKDFHSFTRYMDSGKVFELKEGLTVVIETTYQDGFYACCKAKGVDIPFWTVTSYLNPKPKKRKIK